MTILSPYKKQNKHKWLKSPYTAFIFNRVQLCKLIWAYFPGEAKT